MATEKQVAANRANALRSKGPKTLAGKRRASRNAFRHGLSTPQPLGPISSNIVAEIIGLLDGDVVSAKPQAVAAFAIAYAELLRIREVRSSNDVILARIDVSQLWRIASLDRYERRALTKRRRAESEMTLK